MILANGQALTRPIRRGGRRLRLFLVLVVGLTLTLVCQGHLHEGTYSSAHLTLLGEPDDPASASTGSVIVYADRFGASSSVDVPGKALELPDLSGPGVALVGTGLANLCFFGGLLFCLRRLHSQVEICPESPPPRACLRPAAHVLS